MKDNAIKPKWLSDMAWAIVVEHGITIKGRTIGDIFRDIEKHV